MTSGISDQGFFTSGGVIKTDSLKANNTPQPAKTETESSSQTDTSKKVSDKVASETASAVTDAAVVKISQRMKVGDTGFDQGVSEKVGKAVSAALSKQAARKEEVQAASAGAKKDIGGSYQNKIMEEAKKKAASSSTPPTSGSPTPAPTPSEAKGGDKKAPEAEGPKAKEGHKTYQDEIMGESKKSKKSSESDKTTASSTASASAKQAEKPVEKESAKTKTPGGKYQNEIMEAAKKTKKVA